ncbi:MAG: DMT family transporter [Veillonellales bacterium]
MQLNIKKVYCLLCLTAVLWGGNAIAVKSILNEISPEMLILVRFVGISSILLTIIFWREGKHCWPSQQHVLPLILMGVTGIVLNNGLQFTGLQYSTAINCTLIATLTPAMTALLTGIFFHEHMRKQQWLGIAISFFGTLCLIFHGSWDNIQRLTFNQGDLLFIVAQFAWVFYSMLGQKVMEDMTPLATTAWAGFTGTVLMGVIILYEGTGAPVHLSYQGWLLMLYMIIGSGIIAFILYNVGVSVVGSNIAAIFMNIIPLAGMSLAVILLHEHLGWQEIVGGLWIMIGVYITTHQQTQASKTAFAKT